MRERLAMHQIFEGGDGVQFRVYGWKAGDEVQSGTVMLAVGKYPLSFDVPMEPEIARQLAFALCSMADAAEGI